MKGCLPTGTMVVQVAATDADDPTYGNSARVVYSIIHGQPYFSVEPKTGWYNTLYVRQMCLRLIPPTWPQSLSFKDPDTYSSFSHLQCVCERFVFFSVLTSLEKVWLSGRN